MSWSSTVLHICATKEIKLINFWFIFTFLFFHFWWVKIQKWNSSFLLYLIYWHRVFIDIVVCFWCSDLILHYYATLWFLTTFWCINPLLCLALTFLHSKLLWPQLTFHTFNCSWWTRSPWNLVSISFSCSLLLDIVLDLRIISDILKNDNHIILINPVVCSYSLLKSTNGHYRINSHFEYFFCLIIENT